MTGEMCGAERTGIRSRCSFQSSPHFFHRVLLLMCATAISVPLIYSGRPGREKSTRAAFSVLSSPRGYVRISGDVRHPGIYPIAVNEMTISAIKMAGPMPPIENGISKNDATAYLENGMDLRVAIRPDGTIQLSKNKMTTGERLVLKVPLEINAMSESDFDRVPGIGPTIAKRIAEYRQSNGGRMEVSDLLSIEGIGEKKFNHLLKYF